MKAVELSQVVVSHSGRTVLGPIDLALEEHSFTLIVGSSGSGKTTLLRAIAGLARLETGRVTLFGTPATEARRLLVAPHDRRIGFLFQGGALWPHLSVRRTLEFVLSCRGFPRTDRARRIGELVALVELDGFEERRPGELSGGEAQRLALARALAVDPKLLMLDEPLGPLDTRLRRSLVARLGDLHARLGLTTVYVTHDPGEAEPLATATLHIEAGRIVP